MKDHFSIIIFLVCFSLFSFVAKTPEQKQLAVDTVGMLAQADKAPSTLGVQTQQSKISDTTQETPVIVHNSPIINVTTEPTNTIWAGLGSLLIVVFTFLIKHFFPNGK